MNYLQLDEQMTLTQFRTEIERGMAVYESMVGTLDKNMLADDLLEADAWFRRLKAEREGTPEWHAYNTFLWHGIFGRFRNEAWERLHNR